MSEEDRQRWEARYSTQVAEAERRAREAPSEFLVAHADAIHGRVLDVAAGAGRNSLFLARRGNRVEALDIAYSSLHALHHIAAAEGLPVLVVQVDLDTYPLPLARYDAALNIRYLQRSLFAPLKRAVKPGGLIVFETFLIDQQAVGHPRNPAFLLQHGELRAAFADCDILAYEEGLLPTRTQPAYLARMLARTRPLD